MEKSGGLSKKTAEKYTSEDISGAIDNLKLHAKLNKAQNKYSAAADYYQRLELASDKAKLSRLSSVAKIERANLYNLNLGKSDEADLLYQEVIERLKDTSDDRTYVDSVILYSGFLAKRGYFEKATRSLDSIQSKLQNVRSEIKLSTIC